MSIILCESNSSISSSDINYRKRILVLEKIVNLFSDRVVETEKITPVIGDLNLTKKTISREICAIKALLKNERNNCKRVLSTNRLKEIGVLFEFSVLTMYRQITLESFMQKTISTTPPEQ